MGNHIILFFQIINDSKNRTHFIGELFLRKFKKRLEKGRKSSAFNSKSVSLLNECLVLFTLSIFFHIFTFISFLHWASSPPPLSDKCLRALKGICPALHTV